MSILDRVGRFIDDVLLLPEDLRAELDRAEKALESGDPHDALRGFQLVVDQRPTFFRALLGLGRARAAAGDTVGALEAARRARELDPDDADAALLVARLALELGDANAAADAAREGAARLVRDGGARLAEACELRARAEALRGRPDRAARELRKAIAATPDALALRVALVEALAASSEREAARTAALGVSPGALDAASATRVGLALDRAGVADAALPWLEIGAAAADPAALLSLARRLASSGATERAELLARQAVARGGGSDALARLADVLARTGRDREAADALGAAAASSSDPEPLLRLAARIAPLDDAAALTRHADALERAVPADPAARVARAWACLGGHDFEGAAALLDGVPPPELDSEPRAWLARAAIALSRERAADALASLDALDRASTPLSASDAARAFSLRRDVLRLHWRGPGGEVDLAGAIDAVARFAADRRISDLERRASSLREELDRPLLLAVLGEFNAGKSTLVNAFVGADVAPTGILPTTATLNVLRSGAERRVRVVRRDGTTREGDFASLKDLLDGAHAELDSVGVDHVEIVLPSEVLERVWILDTPGTNAIDAEHEQLAREAMRRADAVLWVFSAAQAGKASEGRVLAELVQSGRVVVPVLNKADRLTDDELGAVLAALAAELPPGLGATVPLAARRALEAKLSGNDDELAASGLPALLERLERDVFSRSRALKRRACASRIVSVVDEALGVSDGAEARAVRDLERLEGASRELEALAPRLVAGADRTVLAIEQAQAAALGEAADEVLAFVRPRTSRFAAHGADLEDRAFLRDVLERRLVRAVRGAADALVRDALDQIGVVELPVADAALLVAQSVRSAFDPIISEFVGVQRGMLAGGALRPFFDDVLPDATLAAGPLAAALRVARADPREGLAGALREGVGRIFASLETQLATAKLSRRAEIDRVGRRGQAPLRALREVLVDASSGLSMQ